MKADSAKVSCNRKRAGLTEVSIGQPELLVGPETSGYGLLVTEWNGATLTRKGEEALWQQFFKGTQTTSRFGPGPKADEGTKAYAAC